ncbi:hypothetical protein [Pleomorphomonas sp. T1.2MG-36]|nr:hypothetical protein [Pleomorphomonas sp. T1.2MG-36]
MSAEDTAQDRSVDFAVPERRQNGTAKDDFPAAVIRPASRLQRLFRLRES